MNVNFSPEELAFQEEVRTFFAEEYPKDILEGRRNGMLPSKEDYIRCAA